jgi:hypothetical protein
MSLQIIRSSTSGDYLVTVAIGGEYAKKWREIVLPSWNEYALRNDVGIAVVLEDLLPKDDPLWKKPNWQKLLLPKVAHENGIKRACYLDTDILINPFAPNVFDSYKEGKIGVTSIRTGMPYVAFEVQKRLAYLRHHFVNPNYPLDSALFFTTKQLYTYHGFEDQGEEFCSGLLLFSPIEQLSTMQTWFNQYDSRTKSITNGGEQTHLNFHLLSQNLASFIDYRFQAIWAYEAAWNHPHIFREGFKDSKEVKKAINNSLLNNHFLHFAGASAESNVIWDKSNFDLQEFIQEYESLQKYSKLKPQSPVLGTKFA